MSSTASTLPQARRPSLLVRLLKPGNTLPVTVWVFLVISQAVNSPFPPSLSTALLVVINTEAVVLFMLRRDATRVGNKVEMVIALSGTFIVSFLEGNEARDTHWLPSAIQVTALLGWAVSLSYLGRSFGIVPADRGLVQSGPYRYVRHPVYAFEALFFIGYMVAVPTPRTAIIIALWAALQITRILREERIISGYEEYRQRVRWRLLPGVW